MLDSLDQLVGNTADYPSQITDKKWQGSQYRNNKPEIKTTGNNGHDLHPFSGLIILNAVLLCYQWQNDRRNSQNNKKWDEYIVFKT